MQVATPKWTLQLNLGPHSKYKGVIRQLPTAKYSLALHIAHNANAMFIWRQLQAEASQCCDCLELNTCILLSFCPFMVWPGLLLLFTTKHFCPTPTHLLCTFLCSSLSINTSVCPFSFRLCTVAFILPRHKLAAWHDIRGSSLSHYPWNPATAAHRRACQEVPLNRNHSSKIKHVWHLAGTWTIASRMISRCAYTCSHLMRYQGRFHLLLQAP